MADQRVVVTGMGLASPLGNDLRTVRDALVEGRHGIGPVPHWTGFEGVRSRIGGLVRDVDVGFVSRKHLRAMGRVAELAAAATKDAVEMAGLSEDLLRSGRVALFYGSTDGSTKAAEDYYGRLYTTRSYDGLLASSYLKFMSHTCAANLASIFGVTGRVVPICSACTSASQSIGEAYWSIRSGREVAAVAGGAEESHFTVAGVFDLMLATSQRYNDRPECTPRPFDRDRDGLILSEGAGTLVLESYDHARARGAEIYAEIVGFGSNCDGGHLTSPSPAGMAEAMRRALESARLSPDDVDYVNAHATGTDVGDVAESRATYEVMGGEIPISSTKSYTGHTLGGCGAIESIFCILMLREGFYPPTRTLENVDARCAPLAYLMGEVRTARPRRIMNNNFAFGGINTSLIFAKV
ncbi:MAG: beta-ketoacyl-ACP synthase [Deltaproteobacteria bacterium]|nr:MAG: beta-ketoacyl-ACP synthase [Deltaproteobacteria bacterium]